MRPRIKSNDGAALCRAALDGLGVSLLADYLVGDHLHSGALVELMPGHQLPEGRLRGYVEARRVAVPCPLIWVRNASIPYCQ